MSGTDAQTAAQQQTPQRAPVATTATQQLVLQSQQAAAAAATGHVILQPGQQLISATPGQHVLASVDGRTQQMTIVQGPTSGSVAAASLLVSSSCLLILFYPVPTSIPCCLTVLLFRCYCSTVFMFYYVTLLSASGQHCRAVLYKLML